MLRHLAVGLGLTACVGGAVLAGPGASAGVLERAVVRPLADPAPECNGANATNCWEYFSWYWTYASCHDTGRQQLANNPGRYNDYICAGDHGAVVWLWLHRRA